MLVFGVHPHASTNPYFIRVADHRIGGFHHFHLHGKFILLPEIIRVKKGNIFTGRPFDAAVSCRTGAFFLLVYDLQNVTQRMQVSLRPVRRPIIDNDQFKIPVRLLQNGINGIF